MLTRPEQLVQKPIKLINEKVIKSLLQICKHDIFIFNPVCHSFHNRITHTPSPFTTHVLAHPGEKKLAEFSALRKKLLNLVKQHLKREKPSISKCFGAKDTRETARRQELTVDLIRDQQLICVKRIEVGFGDRNSYVEQQIIGLLRLLLMHSKLFFITVLFRSDFKDPIKVLLIQIGRTDH